MDFQTSVVVDEAELAESVHEKADSRASGANDASQGFLADLWNDRLGCAFLPEVRQQQKHPCQPLLAGVEQLVNQIFFNLDVPGEKMGDEQFVK